MANVITIPNKSTKAEDISALEVLNTLSNATLVFGEDKNKNWPILFANSGAENLLNRSQASLLKSSFQDVFGEAQNLGQHLSYVFDKKVPAYENDFVIETPQFSDHKLNIQVFPLGVDFDKVLLVLNSLKIGSRIDQHLNNKILSKSVSGMAGVLAHEVKNPLSGIRGAAQLLEQNSSDQDKQLTKLICDECDRIKTLVDEMEVFSNPKSQDFQPQNIHEILNYIKTLTLAGFGKKTNIQFKFDPSLPPIPGNKDQLIQIFLNLIKNAVEASDDNSGEIEIQTAYRHGAKIHLADENIIMETPIEISIKDSGSGIEEKLLPHIFDPFVTDKPGGTGLGLALVRKLVDDHGGFIECKNTSNGTLFRVLFPVWSKKYEL